MRKFTTQGLQGCLRAVTVAAAFLVASTSASAANVQDQFVQWLGHQQKAQFINQSDTIISCYSGKGGACAQGQVTTGTSQCHEESFNVGVGWEVPVPAHWGAFTLNGGYGRSWSTCHERAESVTCSPGPGMQGQGVNWVGERIGRVKLTGANPRNFLAKATDTCPAHWKGTIYYSKGGAYQGCAFVGDGQTIDGYLPEFARVQCNYSRL